MASSQTSINNLLALPFRRTGNISLQDAVKQYISSKYDQHPEMFRNDLEKIDNLRFEAVTIREPHVSGIEKLQTYAAQLAWMGTKFPIDIGCQFYWYPALGYDVNTPISKDNLKFELINVLWNLAALYTQLGVRCSRVTAEGLKASANYLTAAAGVLSHIKTEIIPDLRTDPPDDMDAPSLESLAQLCLAQAQECFWNKAVNDGLKDATVAKLAAMVSDFYALAATEAVQSQAISAAWIHHMSAKHHHFAGAAQFRAACDCLEKRKYGEEVARLQDSLACVKQGLSELKGSQVAPAVKADLQALEAKVKEDLKRAEKDNDVIYLHVVPHKSELKPLDRAKMALLRCPPEVAQPIEHLLDESSQLGPPLFTKLVPFAVHMAVSLYEDNKKNLVEERIVQALQTMDNDVNEDLSSLNLPASLQALEKPLGIPSDVNGYVDNVHQDHALEVIPSCFTKIDALREQCCNIFAAIRTMLYAEELEDEALRKKYGTDRWTRLPSREDKSGASNWSNTNDMEKYLEMTSQSDEKVRKNYREIEPTLKLLSGPRQVLLDFVPSSRRTEVPQPLVPIIGRLRSAYNEILRLQSRRRKKIDSVRLRARQDDVRLDMVKEAATLERKRPGFCVTAADFDKFSEQRLDKLYSADLALIQQEADTQAKLMEEVTKINREFERAKKSLGEKGLGGQERQAALQQLEEGYRGYQRVKNDVEAGLKFYNDLLKMMDQLQSKVMPWIEGRRKEARRFEAELAMPTLATLSLANQESDSSIHAAQQAQRPQTPQPQHYQPQQHRAPVSHVSYSQSPVQQQQRQSFAPIEAWAKADEQHASVQPQHHQQFHTNSSQHTSQPPQQPQPRSPHFLVDPARWTPHMGISFAPTSPAPVAAPAGAAPVQAPPQADGMVVMGQPDVGPGRKPVPGTWDKSRPLRFG